jgi:hypothetical protein
MKVAVQCLMCLAGLLAPWAPGVCMASQQQKAAPSKARLTANKAARTIVPAAAPATSTGPVVLTNDTIIRLVQAGTPESDILTVIEGSPAEFQMDTEHLVKLNDAKVPGAVIRAMLNKKPPAEPEPAPAVPAEPIPVVTSAPDPPPSIPADLSQPLARQGAASVPLAEHPQKIMFVKSERTSAKEAIADLLLSDVGLNLITMGMASQMKMWNPYVGDTLAKARAIGKGLLRSKGTDTRGFEYGMLPGSTSNVTLHEGRPELLIPMVNYVPSADVDLADMQPVLLRLEPRDEDGSRLLTARQVVLKENKKGRFDFKPTVERQELGLEQTAIPVDVELTDNRVYRVAPKQDLAPGEYALVFRRKAESGAFTADCALRSSAQATAADSVQAPMAQMWGAQAPARSGLFGMRKPAAPTAAAPGTEMSVAGFVAFDFRVMR